jgi:hypothetical protein
MACDYMHAYMSRNDNILGYHNIWKTMITYNVKLPFVPFAELKDKGV